MAGAMKAVLCVVFALIVTAFASAAPRAGLASWYGESHRGKLMANGERFDPSKMTAASWSYPLGARVRVRLKDPDRSVIVTITDRGPARSLVREGRIIDLAQAAFEHLARSSVGLVAVTVEPVR